MSLFNKSYDRQFKKSRRLESRASRLLRRNLRKKKKLENFGKPNKKVIFETPKYTTYMKSGRWRKRRLDYYKKFGKKCVICGATNVNLHHVTYDRLGNEEDADLILLCVEHHEQLHEAVSTKRDMRAETYQFIIDTQEAEELKKIIN